MVFLACYVERAAELLGGDLLGQVMLSELW